MGGMTGEMEAAGQGSRDRRKQGRLRVEKEMQDGIRKLKGLWGQRGFLGSQLGRGRSRTLPTFHQVQTLFHCT